MRALLCSSRKEGRKPRRSRVACYAIYTPGREAVFPSHGYRVLPAKKREAEKMGAFPTYCTSYSL